MLVSLKSWQKLGRSCTICGEGEDLYAAKGRNVLYFIIYCCYFLLKILASCRCIVRIRESPASALVKG
jgi:hypothetical protein